MILRHFLCKDNFLKIPFPPFVSRLEWDVPPLIEWSRNVQHKKSKQNLSEDIKCEPHIDSGDARLAGRGNMGLLSCATASDLQSARKSPPWEFWVFLANCSWCRWCVWACKSHNLASAWNSQFCICCFISEQDLLIKHFVFPVSLNRGDAGFV